MLQIDALPVENFCLRHWCQIITQNQGLRCSQSFKVTDVSINWKPEWDFMFRNYRRLLFTFWTLCIFEPPWGLRGNVHCSSYAHWKAGSGLPIGSIELFASCYGWGATSEYWSEIGVFEGGWSVSAKYSGSRDAPSPLRTIVNHFCTDR